MFLNGEDRSFELTSRTAPFIRSQIFLALRLGRPYPLCMQGGTAMKGHPGEQHNSELSQIHPIL